MPSRVTTPRPLALALAAGLGCAASTVAAAQDVGIADPSPASEGIAWLWQGFDLAWSYNHRVNRIASIVEQAPCASRGAPGARCGARATLGAASGTGPDVAQVATHATRVRGEGLAFGFGATDLVLSGREGATLVARAEVPLEVDPRLADQASHVTLLNGFDLAATASADKVTRLALRVGEVRWTADGAVVDVVAELVAACSSLECPPKDDVDYRLRVAVAVMGGREDTLGRHDVVASHSHQWTRSRDRLGAASTSSSLPMPVAESAAVVGVRGLELALGRETHLVALGLRADAASGDAGEVRTVVASWSPRMRDPRVPESLVARRQSGSATWHVDLVAIDLPTAEVTRELATARVAWAGWGRPATLPDATREHVWSVSAPHPPDEPTSSVWAGATGASGGHGLRTAWRSP